MTMQSATRSQAAEPTFTPLPTGLLQRKCAACGTHTPGGGTCTNCAGEDKGLKLQKKLSIGASNDSLEAEADRVADQVLARSPAPDVAHAPLRIQRLSSQADPGGDTAPASVHRTLAGSGAPLEGGVRQDMESRFGHDFSGVRVHSDGAAAQSARDVSANAYTVGNNIVFGAGQYAPGSGAGQRLLAHELTHVVQQGSAATSNIVQRAGMGDVKVAEAREAEASKRPSPDAGAPPVSGVPTDAGPAPDAGVPADAGKQAPCPLSITGPAEVNHLCAAYVPSDAASCGTFPAPNITLTASGAAAGASLTWSISAGATRASIVGSATGTSVQIKGDAASIKRRDVVVSLSNGTCTKTHSITVRQPSGFSTTQTPTSGPTFIQTLVSYTVNDQFGSAMGADICVDETITICSRSHPVSPSFGDAGTNTSGGVLDTLRVSVASGTLPASFCIKLNQSLTAGGCGPLLNNTILFRPSGITLTRSSSCSVGDPCP
jgi:hypothetical protein